MSLHGGGGGGRERERDWFLKRFGSHPSLHQCSSVLGDFAEHSRLTGISIICVSLLTLHVATKLLPGTFSFQVAQDGNSFKLNTEDCSDIRVQLQEPVIILDVHNLHAL